MKKNKGLIVFDMDGTIADLYGVENWLPMLESCDSTPYRVAKPMTNMVVLVALLTVLRGRGYKVAVTSWLSKDGTKEYDREVRKTKKKWLDKFDFPYDELHLVHYGTTKANCTRKYNCEQIIFDDNETVCKGWSLGRAFNPTKVDMLTVLSELILND